MTDVQTNENTPEGKVRYPEAERAWFILFLIGSITFVLALIGTPFHEGLQGIAITLALSVPLFIGIPVTLYSVIHALFFRLNCARFSVMLLMAHFLLFAFNVWIGVMACC